MPSAALVSDLHLTAHPRDAYRWKLFDKLASVMQQQAVSHLFILGDLTEAKDYHSSRLVNRIVDAISRFDVKLYFLRGNHDGLDPNLPYFYFLNHLPQINFIATPYLFDVANMSIAMLPHSRDPQRDWEQVSFLEKADLCFMHQTFTGAISESGHKLDGLSLNVLKRLRRAKKYSGDVHVPQVIGGVTYVEAPYAVRFGHRFDGRIVVLRNFREQVDIATDWAPKRRFVDVYPGRIEADDELAAGDQVKIRIRLAPHEYVDWDECKRAALSACAERQFEVCGLELVKIAPTAAVAGKLMRRSTVARDVNPVSVFSDYCTRQKIEGEVREIGHAVLEESMKA